MLKKQSLIYFYPWIVWLIAGIFYCHQYILRVSISPVADHLMQGFHINVVTLSFIAASFFYAYIIIQIFAGLVLKRYGIKSTIIIAAFMCGLGSLIIAESTSTVWLFWGRGLIGAGSAFALLISIVIARLYFSKKLFPIINGLTISIGTIGGFLGGYPFAFYVTETSWRHVMLVAAIISFIIVLLAVFFIKHEGGATVEDVWAGQSWRDTFRMLMEVLRNKGVWLASIFAGLTFTPIAAFAGLWGVPFLHSEYQVSDLSIRLGVSMIFVGYGIGSPLIGWLSDFIAARHLMRIFSLVSCFMSVYIIYVKPDSIVTLYIIILLLGFFLGITILSMSYVKNQVSIEASPLAFSLVIIMISFASAVLLPLIGEILEHFEPRFYVNGVEEFSKHAYHVALMVIPIALFLGFIISLFLKKSD
jgi:MFS family permease